MTSDKYKYYSVGAITEGPIEDVEFIIVDERGTPTCPQCGGPATEAVEREVFLYGAFGSDAVAKLQADVIVLSCAACGESFTDYRAEEAREAAVARYLAR